MIFNDVECYNELQQIEENGLAIEMQNLLHDIQEMRRLLSNFIKDESCLSELKSNQLFFFLFTKLYFLELIWRQDDQQFWNDLQYALAYKSPTEY